MGDLLLARLADLGFDVDSREVAPGPLDTPLGPEPKQPNSRCGWRSPAVTALGVTVPRNENIAYL